MTKNIYQAISIPLYLLICGEEDKEDKPPGATHDKAIHGEGKVCKEEDTDMEDTWEEVANSGNKMPSITRTNDGDREDTLKCLNGKTSTMSTSLQFNSEEDAASATELVP